MPAPRVRVSTLAQEWGVPFPDLLVAMGTLFPAVRDDPTMTVSWPAARAMRRAVVEARVAYVAGGQLAA